MNTEFYGLAINEVAGAVTRNPTRQLDASLAWRGSITTQPSKAGEGRIERKAKGVKPTIGTTSKQALGKEMG
jgi:hypothetical protein